jgi:hypothetical protein
MATANLAHAATTIDTTNDSIVIVDNLQSIRGGYTLDTTGFAPAVIHAGHPIIEKTSDGTLKPMPATAATSAGVATVGSVTAGTGYTNGTYENVPLSGGTGAGVLATVVVASTVVSTVTVTQAGAGYTVGDVLAVPGAYAGGTGSGGSVPVATIADTAGAFGALPSGHTYAGILINSVFTDKPMAGIMVRGTVNYVAFSDYAYSSILSAIKTALPRIDFRGDR